MDLLTIEEVARRVRVKPKTIANRVYAGLIPSVRPSCGGVRVPALVAEAICHGLQPDELAHVAALCRRYTDEKERARKVREYIASQPVDAPRGRRAAAGAA